VMCHRSYDGDPNGYVAGLYDRLDAILGRLVEAAGPDTDVFLISDHGFRVYEQGVNLNEWLIREGFAVRKREASRSRPESGPLAERRATAHGDRLGELDMSRTRAFALACEGNFGSIRLNVAGREPEGIVAVEEMDAVLTEIEARLGAAHAEVSGPLFPRSFRGAALYPGPHAAVVPDLMVESSQRVRVVATPRRRVTLPYASGRPDHALHGVLVAAGPHVLPQPTRGDAGVADITPTLLHLLGLPAHREMDGASRVAWLRDAGEPVRIAEADDPFARSAETVATDPLTRGAQAELEERLRSLGYAD